MACRCSSSAHPLAFPREFVKTGPLDKCHPPSSPRQINRPRSRRGIVPRDNNVPSFAFDIRSPLHSHENQFPTLYDLCKIDLPNGRTDASSLVTLATGERRPMAVINIRTGNFASLTRFVRELKTSCFFFFFCKMKKIFSLSLSL